MIFKQFNFNIKQKLIGAVIFITLLFGSTIFLYQFALNKTIDGFHLVIHAPIKAASIMDDAKMSILQAQLNRSEYAMTGDAVHLKQMKQHIGTAAKDVMAVRAIAEKAGRTDLLEIFDTLAKYEKQFQTEFKTIESVFMDSNQTVSAKRLDQVFEPVAGISSIINKVQPEAHKDATLFAGMVEEKAGKLAWIAKMVAGAITVLGLCLGFYISGKIANPIIKTTQFAKRISEKDFTGSLDIDQGDEVGMLATALNVMKENLSEIVIDLRQKAEALDSSAAELSTVSTQISSGSRNSSDRSISVSAAAEEMTTNFASVAAAMEQSSMNIGAVAESAEEMAQTITEIAQNTEMARTVSERAVEGSKSVSEKMAELQKTVQAISNFTDAINDISEQTNLLALNATIEAARAGEAGRGFSVVANEIKELAGQTAAATMDIKTKIDDVQHTSDNAIDEIGHVENVISEFDQIVGSIASAIEEQSLTTTEISGNISQASAGIQDVNLTVGESSGAAQSITEDISIVSNQVQETAAGTQTLDQKARGIESTASSLNQLVSQFRIKTSAAPA